ncbi:hypothetical protein E4U37_001865 [Claviceps purpurea]|nr:hypothetical protein E4U37_001865 [Claviceps purpurea]
MRPKEAQMGGHDVFVENTFNVIGILRAQHDPGVNGPGAAPHEALERGIGNNEMGVLNVGAACSLRFGSLGKKASFLL